MEQVITQIGIGLFAGMSLSAAGYFKSRESEVFDAEKFLITTLVGGIVGGISGFTGMAPDVVIAMPMYVGVTVVVENIVKGIKRKLWGN